MKLSRPLLLAAAVLLAACNLDVDPQFRVKDLRILGVRARVAPPPAALAVADASPGDTVTLDALVANPLGRPDVRLDWFACLPVASDAVTPCTDLRTLQDPTRLAPLASGPEPSVVVLGLDAASVTTTVPALAEALGFVVATAKQQPTYACRMYAEIVVVLVASAGDRREVAVKTVRVKPPPSQVTAAGVPDLYVLNRDPAVDDVFRAPTDADACTGGTSIAAGPFPAGRTTLCGTARDGSVEAFNLCDPGFVTSTEETLAWQWYVTDGDFPKVGGVGNATGDHVDFDRPGGAFTLWAILRDGRGGDDWVTYAVSSL